MKSLVESLFDTEKNITKDLTFGDVFKLVESPILNTYFSDHNTIFFSKYMSAVRIRKESKIKCDTENETIYRGLLKIINEIKFTPDTETTDLFKDYLNLILHPYYQASLSEKYKHVSVQIYKNGRYVVGQEQNMLDGDFDEIQIFPCQNLNLKFVRK
jgi:hypothetical protein